MKKVLTAAAVAFLLVSGAGTALATGPGGSTENGNQVTCGGTPVAAGTSVHAAENGAEVCSSEGAVTQGRIIATSEDGGYVAADGDADNTDTGTTGFIRVNSDGSTSCGADADADNDGQWGDSTNPDDEDVCSAPA